MIHEMELQSILLKMVRHDLDINPCLLLREVYEFAYMDQEVNIEALFNEQDNFLIWRWSTNGSYSSGSFYKVILTGGKIKWNCMEVWTSYSPTQGKNLHLLGFKKQNSYTSEGLCAR